MNRHLFVLFFIFILLLATNVSLQGHLALAQTQFRVGDYAQYSMSNISLQYLLGYGKLGALIGNMTEFSNLTSQDLNLMYLKWIITDMRNGFYVVNYSLAFQGIIEGQKPIEFKTTVLVSTTNNTAYYLNGTTLGTWPYWLSPSLLQLCTQFVVFHRHPNFLFDPQLGQMEIYETRADIIGLPGGNAYPIDYQSCNYIKDSTLLKSQLEISNVGIFKTDRLLVSYPVLNVTVRGNLSVISIGADPWVAVYDRFTGMMLAYDMVDEFTDDIMMHSQIGIITINNILPTLILTSTNVNLSPDNKSGIPIFAILIAIATTMIVVITSLIYLRRRR